MDDAGQSRAADPAVHPTADRYFGRHGARRAVVCVARAGAVRAFGRQAVRRAQRELRPWFSARRIRARRPRIQPRRAMHGEAVARAVSARVAAWPRCADRAVWAGPRRAPPRARGCGPDLAVLAAITHARAARALARPDRTYDAPLPSGRRLDRSMARYRAGRMRRLCAVRRGRRSAVRRPQRACPAALACACSRRRQRARFFPAPHDNARPLA